MKVFQFEHPEYLWLITLAPVFYLLWFYVRWHDRKHLLAMGDEKLIKQLIKGSSKLRQNWKFFFANSALILLAFALANPQLGSKMEKSTRKGIDLIIAIDISNSMLAQDLKPNRLERSKMAISRLINDLQGDKLGIIAYTARAYTLLPITTDYGAARMFLNNLNVDYINQQGTSIASAINLAHETFTQKKSDKKNQALIIISDGEDHEEGAIEAAKKAQMDGITIFTIGMGLPSGAPIPQSANRPGAGFKKDREGNTIISRLNENLLKDIANAGNGFFVRASNSNTGLEKIYDSINEMEKNEIETRSFKEYEGWFQLFAGLAILFLVLDSLIGRKKGKLEQRFTFFN
jgi:Ca-activated chloride channel family protein